jgi:hypothetical protein
VALVVTVSGVPAFAAYSATTTNDLDTWRMSAASTWSCVNETAVHTARFYAFQETAGTTAYNTGTLGAAANGTFQGGYSIDQSGPDCGAGATRALTLNGSSGYVSTGQAESAPSTFTLQTWFRTSSGGGKLIGFTQYATGGQGQFDRQIYMTTAGALVFGVWNSGPHHVTSTAGYADGVWHLATATFGSGGMALYIDGALVGSDSWTQAEPIPNGYWRIGGSSVSGWPSAPSNGFFDGSLAHVAVWNTALTPAQVAAQYTVVP